MLSSIAKRCHNATAEGGCCIGMQPSRNVAPAAMHARTPPHDD